VSDTADVVVVGAGLSGLACASALRDFDVCVLESSARAGGRVHSVKNPFATLDLGACFAVGADVFPDPANARLPEPRLAERGPIGMLWKGALHWGESGWDCLQRISWSDQAREQLSAFREGRLRASSLPPEARRLVDALFKQIHPGEVGRYIPARQLDALQSFFPDHYPEGNGSVVDAWLEALGPKVRLSLEARVIAIQEEATSTLVEYQTPDGGRRTVRSSAVVVATPATVARRLVRPTRPECAAFLESVQYGTYTAVGLVFDAPELARFRYLVTPELPMDVVIQQAARDGRHRSLICYYSNPSQDVSALDDDALVDATVRHLNQSGSGVYPQSRLVFSAVQRWPLVGTLMTPDYFAKKVAGVFRATDRVFLAGDYVSSDPEWGYGTVDAVRSGKETAAALRAQWLRET
jgi:protoporphyrinogen oxidase